MRVAYHSENLPIRSRHVCAFKTDPRVPLSRERSHSLPPFLEVGPSLPVCREREKERLFPYPSVLFLYPSG